VEDTQTVSDMFNVSNLRCAILIRDGFLFLFSYHCESKIRDKTLFVTHVLVSAVLGVFCGERSAVCKAVAILLILNTFVQVASTSTQTLRSPASSHV
jgi:hypothetical protein